ncbi:hypothetical protein [Azohydromonas caseinilytica]|uniref:Phage baseplate protein n=1 Tax=Azohydromonas caseinilytica TaxID=2728836 RepID=A0A848FBX5_9BURK|nr:hypothetical protein [Azohydromonas caseinilytica]NML16822.1 hypothetical protein [Azohydromonas caseinilytica]
MRCVAFGSDPAHLAARLDPRQPALAVDALLRACVPEQGGEAPRWSLARRLDALLAVRLAEAPATEAVPLRCPQCGAGFEAEIDLAACRRAPGGDTAVEFEARGRRLRARLPTGADHARWQREGTPLRAAAAELLEDGAPDAVDEASVQALNEALAAQDPLRELVLSLECPDCGATAQHTLDLEAHLIAAFARAQRQLLAEIATLARSFHWSERDIAALPAWRRAFYLGCIDDGA